MRKIIEKTLAFSAFLLIWVSPRGISGFDSSVRLSALETLFRNHELTPMKYSFVGPIFSYPLLILGHVWKNPHFFIISFNAILISILYVILFRFTQSYKTIIALGLFSILPLSTGNFDAEPFSVLMTCGGFILWTQRHLIRGSGLLALAAANTPALLAPTGLVSLYFFLRIKRTKSVFVAPLLGATLFMTENFIKFGNLQGDYLQSAEKGLKTILPFSGLEGFSYPFLLGIAAILFSFGKGILFYLPGSFLAHREVSLAAKNKSVVEFTNLLSVYFVGMILMYAKWWSWYGGFSWGPRFFMIGSVLSSLFLVYSRSHVTFILVLLLQGWSAFTSLAMNTDAMQSCLALGQSLEFLCWYSPEYSPLFLPFWKPWPTIALRNWIHGLLVVIVFVYYAVKFIEAKRRKA